MGEARRKLIDSSKIITFDLSSPKLAIFEGDRKTLSADGDESNVVYKAGRNLILTVIGAKFPQGMDRAAGKIWAAWIEALEDGNPIVEMPKAQLEWLYKIMAEEELKVPAFHAQWREAMVDAMKEALDAAAIHGVDRPELS